MRRSHFDEHEFDAPDSEQSLDLAISSPRQHGNLGAFLAACGASSAASRSPRPGWSGWPTVAEHLRRFAVLELPRPSQWREALLARDDWNDMEIGIAFGSVLVWYHWFTSA